MSVLDKVQTAALSAWAEISGGMVAGSTYRLRSFDGAGFDWTETATPDAAKSVEPVDNGASLDVVFDGTAMHARSRDRGQRPYIHILPLG